MGKGILDLTSDLVEIYLYHRGLSEVPKAFDEWSCLTLISACLADRVWFQKGHSKVYPNLFTFLLGPSGCGKGEAIDLAGAYAECLPAIHYYRGEITAKGMLKFLASTKNDGKIFYVAEEAGMAIGEGSLARDFIKALTGLYKGGTKYTKGVAGESGTPGEFFTVDHHNIVVFLGSTRKWMVESIPVSAIEGGWLARTANIEGDYAEHRVEEPTPPPDVDAISKHLHLRFAELCQVQGQFTLTDEARELHRHWYMERPRPVDESILPSWRREDDLVYKLSMLVANATKPTLVGTAAHWSKARQLGAAAMRSVPSLISYASQTPETEKLEIVANAIRRAGKLPHSVLLRMVSKRGIDAKLLNERIIPTLAQERRIVMDEKAAARTYLWVSRRGQQTPPTDEEESA